MQKDRNSHSASARPRRLIAEGFPVIDLTLNQSLNRCSIIIGRSHCIPLT